jgi:hypothetical protein
VRLGERVKQRERCCPREKERCRERDEQREDLIDGGPTLEEQDATSGYGSSTDGRRCYFWWPEPTSGEAGTVREVLLVCVLHNFI